jgi:hypothetical protein
MMKPMIRLRANDADGSSWPAPTPVVSTGGSFVNGLGFAVITGEPAILYAISGTVWYVKAFDSLGATWSISPVVVDSGNFLGFMEIDLRTRPSGTAWPVAFWYDFSLGLLVERANATSGNQWTRPGHPLNPQPSSNGQRIHTADVNGVIGLVYNNSGGNLYYNHGDFVTSPVSVDPATGLYHGSVYEVNGRPAIAYYDFTNGRLLYKRADDATGSAWTAPSTVVDAGGGDDVGSRPSLIIVNGNPAIAYVNETTNRVEYLRSDDVNGAGWTGTPVSLMRYGSNIDPTLLIANGSPAIVSHNSSTGITYWQADDANGDSWDVCSSSSQSESESSTSQSSPSSGSSSSSEPIKFTEVLNQIVAGNNPDNLILFTYTPEGGFDYEGDDQTIQFQFRTVNNEFFNYDTLLNPTTPTEIEGSSNCYVPEDDDVNIKHDPIFYVDLIVKDSGVKNVSVRSQEEKYQEESVKYSFIMMQQVLFGLAHLTINYIKSNTILMRRQPHIAKMKREQLRIY